jgi:hypothetical protein
MLWQGELPMATKNEEDLYSAKIVLFTTQEQKARLQKWCEKNNNTMSAAARSWIESLNVE